MFGYKSAWIAVRTSDIEDVAQSCGLTGEVEAVDLKEAVERVSQHFSRLIAVIGPVDGWTLVYLDLMFMDLDDTIQMTGGLSSLFGEAQLFSSYRVVGCYSWARCIEGDLDRHVLISGRRCATKGKPTPVELGISFRPFFRRIDDDADQETVLAIAEAWSVNPLKSLTPNFEHEVLIGECDLSPQLPSRAQFEAELNQIRR